MNSGELAEEIYKQSVEGGKFDFFLLLKVKLKVNDTD